MANGEKTALGRTVKNENVDQKGKKKSHPLSKNNSRNTMPIYKNDNLDEQYKCMICKVVHWM